MISLFFNNEFYDTDEAYLFAIAEAMRHEYEAIASAGAFVQLDCPGMVAGCREGPAAARVTRVHDEPFADPVPPGFRQLPTE